MTVEPPEQRVDGTDPIRGTHLERTIMASHCPDCGTELNCSHAPEYHCDCPNCGYCWIPGLVEQ